MDAHAFGFGTGNGPGWAKQVVAARVGRVRVLLSGLQCSVRKSEINRGRFCLRVLRVIHKVDALAKVKEHVSMCTWFSAQGAAVVGEVLNGGGWD
jgi:hypothetical protein